jgi:hypothetical protein
MVGRSPHAGEGIVTSLEIRPAIARRALGFACVAIALAGCAVTPPERTDRPLAADGSVCPDPRRPLPFPLSRPDCWTDAEWSRYLELETDRATNDNTRYGDRF